MIDGTIPSTSRGMRLLDLLERQQIATDVILYSLIDGAKHNGLRENRSVEMFPLLVDAGHADAHWAGPVLVRHVQGDHCPLLAQLLSNVDSPSFLSLIASNVPLEELSRRLTLLSDVRHEDGTEWVMRYYDPLILPHWLAVLDSDQRDIALSGIAAWLYVDVRGQPQQVSVMEGEMFDAFASDPMLLSEKQCEELMDLTMPYILMSLLEDDDPDVLSSIPPYQCYDFFALQLARAHGYGLTSPAELKTYALLALMLGANFDQRPLASELLGKTRQTKEFSSLVLQWTPEEWLELGTPSHAGVAR